MGRCLIVANQTLGGEELDRAVQDSINRDITHFYVVTPVTPVEQETTSWTGGFAVDEGAWSPEAADRARAAMEESARRREAALLQARRRSQSRLDQMVERITSAGATAEGHLGAANPVEAAKAVLEDQSFDQVIVSTLPSGLSRWLRMDLPHRIARMTDAPVTTVEAARDEVST